MNAQDFLSYEIAHTTMRLSHLQKAFELGDQWFSNALKESGYKVIEGRTLSPAIALVAAVHGSDMRWLVVHESVSEHQRTARLLHINVNDNIKFDDGEVIAVFHSGRLLFEAALGVPAVAQAFYSELFGSPNALVHFLRHTLHWCYLITQASNGAGGEPTIWLQPPFCAPFEPLRFGSGVDPELMMVQIAGLYLCDFTREAVAKLRLLTQQFTTPPLV